MELLNIPINFFIFPTNDGDTTFTKKKKKKATALLKNINNTKKKRIKKNTE